MHPTNIVVLKGLNLARPWIRHISGMKGNICRLCSPRYRPQVASKWVEMNKEFTKKSSNVDLSNILGQETPQK